MSATEARQDRQPNFRDEDGRLFLVRCFVCGGEHGRENRAMLVAQGICAWCNWQRPGGPVPERDVAPVPEEK